MAVTGLGGEIIAFTYPALIKIGDNDTLPTTTGGDRNQPGVFTNPNKSSLPNALALLTDGLGLTSSLSIGRQEAGAQITGPTIITAADRSGHTSGKLLDVKGGGVYIEDQLTVQADSGEVTPGGTGVNKICGTTCLNTIIVANNSTFQSNLSVIGTSTFDGQTTHNGGICVNGNTSITGNLTVDGNINATGDITAFSTSDKRLKNNIIKIDNSNNVINSLNGYTYNWDEKSGKTGEGVGVIAQEVKELIPSAVRENEDGYLSVDYLKLIPYLIEEVKSLNNRIKTLEGK
jgi:hypothetical protein